METNTVKVGRYTAQGEEGNHPMSHNTFHSITHKFSIGALECYLIVTMVNGIPSRIECKNSKTGSTLRELTGAWCLAVTVALEMGATPQKIIETFQGISFPPAGMTNNPEIPQASSLVDYICQWMARQFYERPPEGVFPALPPVDGRPWNSIA